MKKTVKISKEELEEKYINQNLSTLKIAELYDCTRLCIRNKLLKFNIPIKNKNGLFGEKYSYNKDYFKSWSSDMAWLLGYIAADGSIRPKKYELRIKSIDLELLERTKFLLNSNNKISWDSKAEIYILNVYGKEIVSDLQNLGIKYRKSWSMELPQIPKKYFWDYLRGLIDGDGSINDVEFSCVGMNIVGHDKHLISIRDILQKEIDCYQYELNYNCEDSNTCTLPIYGINARNLLEKVYHKDYYGLSRKKQLALKLIDFYDRKIFCKQCFKELEYRNFKGKSKKKYCDFCLKEIKNERNRKNYKKAKNSKC